MILVSFPPTPSLIKHFAVSEELLLNLKGKIFFTTPIRRISNFPLGVACEAWRQWARKKEPTTETPVLSCAHYEHKKERHYFQRSAGGASSDGHPGGFIGK